MPRIKRVPLPDPFTADAAVQHLYMALTNQGIGQLHQIALINPRMVDALYALWRRDHPNAHGSSERKDEEQIGVPFQGSVAGRWRVRAMGPVLLLLRSLAPKKRRVPPEYEQDQASKPEKQQGRYHHGISPAVFLAYWLTGFLCCLSCCTRKPCSWCSSRSRCAARSASSTISSRLTRLKP